MTASITGPQILSTALIDDEGVLSKPRRVNQKHYDKIREMRKDPTIALARSIAIAPMLLASWSVEKEANAPPGAQEEIARQLQPYRAHLLKHGGNGSMDFGWSPFEKVFGLDSTGRNIIKKLKPLLQDITDICVTEDGSFDGFLQPDTRPNNFGQPDIRLDVQDCLLLNFDVEGTNWYGQGLMDIAMKPYDAWEQTEAGAKRYDSKLAGTHWIIYYPQGTSTYNGVADTDNLEIARGIIRDLQSSGVIAIPSSLDPTLDDLNRQLKEGKPPWRIELINDGGSGGQVYIDRGKYLDALKVRAFGMPERSILEGTFGTKAEAETHGDIAIVLMETRHQTFCQQINWYLVNQLLRYNYGEGSENTVYIKPAPLTDTAIGFLRELFKTLIADPTAGVLLLEKIDQESLFDRLSIPVKPLEDTQEPAVIDPATAPEEGIEEWPTVPGI